MSNLAPIEYARNEIASYEQDYNSVLVDEKLKFQREAGFAMQYLQSNDYLLKVAGGNHASLKNAIINVASIGVSLNPAQKLCYLVPRRVGNNSGVCLDISYMGLMHIAQQSGAIMWCQSAIVRANDQFELNGLDKAPTHKYNTFATSESRGDIVGAYVVVKTPDGDYLTHTMRIEDIYSIRDRSEAWKSFSAGRAKSCPWVTDEEQMILKTVVKQASKYWPRRERLDAAIDYVNTDAGEGIQFENNQPQERNVTPITEEQNDRINQILITLDRKFEAAATWCSNLIGRKVSTQSELTSVEAEKFISSLERTVANKNKIEAE